MQSIAPTVLWPAFLLFVALMLALDLGVFHRKSHRVRFREAAIWSAVWVALAISFNAGIYLYFGEAPALEFATGYLIEKALAVDNIFIFAMIFAALGIPAAYQHRVLFWGVIGAVVLRAVMIGLGAALFHHFHWTIYFFGALLIVTGVKFLLAKEVAEGAGPPKWVAWLGRVVPLSEKVEGDRFFIKRGARTFATPLFVALVAVELSDVVFAIDSIPAIFGITRDPFIVFTSNIFAILGLRSMYFLLASMIEEFAYLKHGLSAVLIFVGVKMLASHWLTVPVGASLAIIGAILGTAMLVSLAFNPRDMIPKNRLYRYSER